MNVALASDENYAKYLLVAVYSIIKSHFSADITFYIIDNGISPINKKSITEVISRFKKNIVFLQFDMMSKNLVVDGTFPIASYSRLFLTTIKEIDRVIYMDCDAAVYGDIRSLWEMDLAPNEFVAGVVDPVFPFYKELIGLNKNDIYVNAGVLLMDLKRLREFDWENKVINLLKNVKGTIPHHDQGIINCLLANHIRIIEPKYNVMDVYFLYTKKQMEDLSKTKLPYNDDVLEEARKRPVFVHYTAGYYGRIWDVKCRHPLKDNYRCLVKDLNLDEDSFFVDEIENNHAVKMRRVYELFPFAFYSLISFFISKRKKRMWLKQYKKIGIKRNFFSNENSSGN